MSNSTQLLTLLRKMYGSDVPDSIIRDVEAVVVVRLYGKQLRGVAYEQFSTILNEIVETFRS